jgi:hypothetical protein
MGGYAVRRFSLTSTPDVTASTFVTFCWLSRYGEHRSKQFWHFLLAVRLMELKNPEDVCYSG